jgi:hypothetical protein
MKTNGHAMKTNLQKNRMTFGEFITDVYSACGKRRALGIVRLALNAHLVVFRGHDHFGTS